MRNGLLFFLGLVATLAFSWAGVVLWPHYQLSKLAPLFDENEGKAFPLRVPGLAAQGAMVYADLGCASCHTQQVRRPGFGADRERGWGEHQSVARDYVYRAHVQLGEMRIGPDLANVGNRKAPYDAEDLMKLLYTGAGAMPPYRFLFEQRSTAGRQPSDAALSLHGNLAPPLGEEIVPTRRARALVAYLLSLQQGYEYPEAVPVEPEPAAEETKQ